MSFATRAPEPATSGGIPPPRNSDLSSPLTEATTSRNNYPVAICQTGILDTDDHRESSKFSLAGSERLASAETSSRVHSGGASDYDQLSPVNTAPQPTKFEHVMMILIFTLVSTTAIYYWNSIVNCLYNIEAFIYPEYPNMSDTMLPTFDTVAFVSSLGCMWIGALHSYWLYIGTVIMIICSVGCPLTCQYAPPNAGFYLLHFLMAIAGAGCAFMQCTGYGYAVCYFKSYATYASLGMGVAGLLSLAVWNLLVQVCFPQDRHGTLSAVWVHFAVSLAVSLATLPAVVYYFRMDIIQKWQIKARELAEYEAEHKGSEPMSLWRCFRATMTWQLHLAWTFGMSYMIFPNVAPYAFRETVSDADWAVALFQVTDFVGRDVVSLARWLPLVMIPKKVTEWLSCGRVILLVLALLVMYLPADTAVLKEYWFQMLLIAGYGLTNGWYSTLAMIYLPQDLTLKSDKGRASTIGTTLFIGAIALGLWITKLLKLGYHE